MKRKLWTLLLTLGAALALCVGASAETETTELGDFYEELMKENGYIQMKNDVDYGSLMEVSGTLTIDLNDHVLEIPSGIYVAQGAHLTIKDSSAGTTPHSFKRTGGRWEWDKTGTETANMMTVFGGIITGGTGKQDPKYPTPGGGGVYVAPGGTLTMEGGSIAGCSAGKGGGVYVEGTFTMSGSAAITSCTTDIGETGGTGGGGVYVSGTFTMNGSSAIAYCTTDTGITGGTGGGVWVEETGMLTMNDNSAIRDCTARTGGGVTVNSGASSRGRFIMNGGRITGCKATNDTGGGGGIFNSGEVTMTGGEITNCTASHYPNDPESGGVRNDGQFTMSGGTIGADCTIFNIGSSRTVFTISGGASISADITNCCRLHADGGSVSGTVKNGHQYCSNPGTITGSGTGTGSTTFHGNVENISGTIEKGKFEGSVTNSGTISGGEFTGTVTNNAGGIITGGDFSKATSLSGNLTVTFDPDNGESASTQTVAWAKDGTTLTEPSPAPTKEGYRFDGWYYDNNGSRVKWNFDTDKVTRTMTLKAKWASMTYTVTYYAGQYANEKDDQTDTKIHGQPLTLKGAIFTRSGYTQTGWTTGQVNYALGGTYTNNVEVVLHPVWTANPPAPSYDDSDPTYAVSAPTAENGKITVSPRYAERGERVTVTVTPDEGYELGSLTVTDSRGDALELTDLGGGRYRFTMPARRVEVKANFVKTVEVSPFADVATDAYYYEAVKWAVKNGITDGVGNDLFAPGQPCTRAQIVTFLWRAAGSPEPKGTAAGMTDVVSGSYYEKAVAWAIENGITAGTGEGKFSPDATCTRAQAVTFLARALNAKASGAAEFSDVPTDSYFAEAVAWAAANGVTEGVGNGLFAPDNDCTRGQIVTFLWRAYTK